MASQAEIDLVVNASRTLPELERDLDRVLAAAQRGMDDVDVQATINTTATVNNLVNDLNRVAAAAAAGDDDIDLQAVLNQRATLVALNRDLQRVTASASRGVRNDLALTGVLNRRATLQNVRTQLDEVALRAQQGAPDIHLRADVDVDEDRITRTLRGLARGFSSLSGSAGALGRVAAGFTSIGLAAGAVIPVLAGVVAATEQIAPAAAVATSGITAMTLAAGTLVLGLHGVGDAVKDAFDPGTKAEDLKKALDGLAPSARKFVLELRGMKDRFKNLQLGVQERLFKNLSGVIKPLADAVMPSVKRALDNTATSLNHMGISAAKAAIQLGRDGTLGKALDGAAKGMANLEDVPGRLTTAFGQLAAASAPAFNRITLAVDRVVKSVSDRLNKAFKSGALETAINDAVSALRQLGTAAGNVFGGIRNIFAGVTVAGGGLFDKLVELTQAFQDLTASKEFQAILSELIQTADTLVKTVLPILKEAFKALAPVITELGPPVRDFIKQVGPVLMQAVKDLAPVLLDLARIIKDVMPIAIALVNAALQTLSIAFKAVHTILDHFIIPIVNKVSKAFDSTLVRSVQAATKVATDNFVRFLGKFEAMRQGLQRVMSQSTGDLSRYVQNIKSKLVSGITTAAARAVELFRSLRSRIANTFANAGSTLFNAGVNLVKGLGAGIKAQLGNLLQQARDMASSIANTVKNALGIHSPSTVMRGFGENTVEGFILGLRSMIPQLQNELSSIASAAPLLAGGVSDAGSMALPQTHNAFQQTVVVNIGGEQFTGVIDSRIKTNQQNVSRVAAQGVRR